MRCAPAFQLLKLAWLAPGSGACEILQPRRQPDVSAPPAWLLVEPPHGVAARKAEFVNTFDCFLARQWNLVSVMRQVGAVALHNLVQLGAKAFI